MYWRSGKSVRISRAPHGHIFQITDTATYHTFVTGKACDDSIRILIRSATQLASIRSDSTLLIRSCHFFQYVFCAVFCLKSGRRGTNLITSTNSTKTDEPQCLEWKGTLSTESWSSCAASLATAWVLHSVKDELR